MSIEDYGGGQGTRSDVLVVTTNDAADVGTEVCAYGTAVVLTRE